MSENSPVSLEAHDNFRDSPAEPAREGAWRMLTLVLEAEAGELLARYDEARMPDGRKAAVRSGCQPRRDIRTGAGPVSVRIPKTRSCTGEPAAFRSAPVPPRVRKAASVEAFVPWLYLKGEPAARWPRPCRFCWGPRRKGSRPRACRARRSSGTGKWSNGAERTCPTAAGPASGRTGSAAGFGPRTRSCAPWRRSATGPWDSGRRWTRRIRTPATGAAGCARRAAS